MLQTNLMKLILLFFSPADNATAVATTSNIILNFSEAIDVESGNIVIYKSSDDSVVELLMLPVVR